MIKYINGDATYPIEVDGCNRVIIHICNDIGAWGSGFVMSVSKRWKEPEFRYRQWYKDVRNSGYEFLPLGNIQINKVEEDIAVINMIAQHRIRSFSNPNPIDYNALRSCLAKTGEYCRLNKCSVHMPKIGTARAGGDWELIKEMIEEELVCQGIPVYVYIY